MKVFCKVGGHQYQAEIIIEPDDGGYHAFCTALKGLHTCGETRQEAENNAIYAVTAYIKSLIKHSEPVPLPCEDLVTA